MSAPAPQLPPDANRGSSLIADTWITVSIASLLVCIRLYTRAFLRKTAGADDWTIVIALAFAVAQSILTVFQVNSGFGRHVEYLDPDQISNILLLTTILELLHTVGTLLVRISVCLFVLRLVPPTHHEFYRYTYVLIAFFSVVSAATCLLILLGCNPIQGTWDMRVAARCIPRSTLSTIAKTQGGLTVLMDLLCVGLPIFFLRNLQARPGRKISLFILLGLGLFTAACAILRATNTSFENPDFTYVKVTVALWACLEQNVGITVASAPALHQLYTIVLERVAPQSGSAIYPHMRALKPFASAGGGHTRSSSDDGVGFGQGSRGIVADPEACTGAGAAAAGGTVPPSPVKKAPRTDYDKASLDISPRLEQAATSFPA